MIDVGSIAKWVEGEVVGDASRRISGIAELATAGPQHLSFLTDRRYYKRFCASRAGCFLVKAGIEPPNADCALIVCSDPYLALAQIASRLDKHSAPTAGVACGASVSLDAEVDATATVAAGAVIDDGAKIGARVQIGALVYIGAHTSIGADTMVHAGAKVMARCTVGSRVILHPGCVVGSEGFGFAKDPSSGRHYKMPQMGSVHIGDDVEIGANSTIDRATFGKTVIGAGTKIDNLVQIGHNVSLGAHNIIVSQSGVAGSSQLGDNVVIGAQGGVAGHLRICDGVMLAARAGVLQDIDKAGVYSGLFGVMPHQRALKMTLAQAQLPELRRKVQRLESKLDGLASLPNDL